MSRLVTQNRLPAAETGRQADLKFVAYIKQEVGQDQTLLGNFSLLMGPGFIKTHQ